MVMITQSDKMPPVKSQAIVIKAFDFRETSIICTLYSRDFGKINAILKGIRTIPSKFSSTLEPFSLNQIVFYLKRNSSLHLVSQADLEENFTPLRNDATKIATASVMMELLDAVLPQEEASPDIFDLSLNCLKAMCNYFYVDKIATIFKIKLLVLSGFRPHFDSCIGCGQRIIDQAKFSVEMGGLLCVNCFKKDYKARSIFRGTVATILHIEKSDFENNLRLGINPQIKRELDSMLASFIDFHIDKKIKSQNVLDAVKLKAVVSDK